MSLPSFKNPPNDEKQLSPLDEKDIVNIESAHDNDSNFGILDSERDIATHIISVHDDPTLNPWTLRAFIVGIGLSAFGSVLGKLFFALRYYLVFLWFGQRRSITSNLYELLFLTVQCQLIQKPSTAGCSCLDIVLGHYLIYSWDGFGRSDTTTRILPLS